MTQPGPAAPLIGQGHNRLRRQQGLRWVLGSLPVLLALLAIWAAARDRLLTTTYDAANGVAGELVAGRRVGQTFVAAHAGLSAIDLQLATYARPNPGMVVVHLRRSVSGPDLRTVTVPAATLADNAWHRFAFSPLADSYRQEYYLELEQPGATLGHAITAYWNTGRGDPYPYGQAISDGQPLDGDLAFGLGYSPPPGALWADLWTVWRARLPASLSGGVLVAGVACLGLLGALLWGAGHGWFSGSRRRTARLGVLLGLFALAHGTLWLIAVPPWQGPDEFSHYAVADLIAASVSPADSGPAALAVRARIEHNILTALDARQFTRMVSWYDVPGGPASGFVNRPNYGGSTMFLQARQPLLYYSLAAVPLRLITPDPSTLPADIGLYVVRATSVLWAAVGVWLAWGCALLLAPGPAFRRLWLILPLTVALLPMRAAIDSAANNDVLAECAVSGVFLLVVGWIMRWWRQRGTTITAAVGTLALVALSLAAKATTSAPAAGLLWLGGFGGSVIQGVGRLAQPRRIAVAALGVAGMVVIACLGIVLTGFDGESTAQGWDLTTAQHAPRSAVNDAHSGRYVLDLPAGQAVAQRLDVPTGPTSYRLLLHAWVRPAPGAAAGRVMARFNVATLPVSDTLGVAAWSAQDRPIWQPITATAIISPGITFVYGELQSDTPAQADDALLTMIPVTAGAAPVALDLLNPTMEAAGLQLRAGSLLARVLHLLPAQLTADRLVDTLVNTQSFDKVAVGREYLAREFQSYWGWFGWLGLPQQLPEAQYSLLGVLTLGGLLGWPAGLWLRPRLSPSAVLVGGIVVVALVGTVALGLARQMMQWALYGLRDFPQGRYLFVLIIPTTWLWLTGWRQWIALLTARVPGRFTVSGTLGGVAWIAWLGFVLLIYLDLYALLVLVLPYYYGRF